MKIKNSKKYCVWRASADDVIECWYEDNFETLDDAIRHIDYLLDENDVDYFITIEEILMQPKEVNKALKRMKK